MLYSPARRCLLSWNPSLSSRYRSNIYKPSRLADFIVRKVDVVSNNRICLYNPLYRDLSSSTKLPRPFTSCVNLIMADQSAGKGPGEGDQPVKTAKQLKKDAEKKEKMEKFLAKQAKQAKMKENTKSSKVMGR